MFTQMLKVKMLLKVVLWALLLTVFLTAQEGIASDTTGVTDDEVRIGIFHSLTGPASVLGMPVMQCFMTIINQTNEAGRVHGRKVTIIAEDDANNPEKAKAATKKLIYSDKVFALSGSTSTLGAWAAKPEIEGAKVPWLGGSAVMDKVYLPTFPTTFGLTSTASLTGRSMLRFALSKPDVKKVVIVYHHDEWGKGHLDAAIAELEKEKTKKKVEWRLEVIDRGITDASAAVLKIKNYNPDAVAVILYPQEGAIFVRDAYKYGLNIPLVLPPAANDLRVLRKRSGIPDSMKWVFVGLNATYCEATASDPKYANINAALKKYYPQATVQNINTWGFAYGKIIVEVLKRSGRDLTREKFLDVLENLKDFDTGVLSSKVSFSKSSHLADIDLVYLTLKRDETEYFLDRPEWDLNIMKKKNWE